jgi:hypothetical protein
MTLKDFQDSLHGDTPPPSLGFALTALWWDGKGNWQQAHESAQQDEGPAGSWVHAYLHRKEAEIFNAEYWYRRAGKNIAQGSLEQEWLSMVESLLADTVPPSPS